MGTEPVKTDTTKSTILVISMGLLILHVAFSWQWALTASLIIGIIGIVSTYLSRKIEWAWMKLARVLEYIVPNVLLTIVFFLFLYPLSVLSKLFTKDPLMLSRDHASYFVDVHKVPDKKSFENIW
jgi:hypothetical protein